MTSSMPASRTAIKLLTLFLSVSIGLVQAAPHDVLGTFITGEKDSHVTIEPCGDDSLCGTIVWLNATMLEPGVTPETARSKAGDPVVGLTILEGFERKKNDWRGGTIYHPGRDKLYSSRLKRLADGNLQVKGCIAFICQTQVWIPVIP